MFDKYLVACQRGGVSIKLPDLQAATRHGPLTDFDLTKCIRTNKLLKLKKTGPTLDLF